MAYPSVQALMRGQPSPADLRFVEALGRSRSLPPSWRDCARCQMVGWRRRAPRVRRCAFSGGAVLGLAAFLSRCVVLQAIGAAGIVGLWIAGIANKPFEGDNAFLCWLIVGIAGLGILCVFLQRWRDVEWLATHVVRIGLLGTVVGLIIAFLRPRPAARRI